MKICEILSVGTELLLGDVVDTNAAYLSRSLRSAGFAVLHRQTCGDNADRLAEAVRLALSRSDVVLMTGGLGPTYDDITREITAAVLGLPLRENEKAKASLTAYFARRGIAMSENNLRQALVPEGAEVLQNDWGTAPGLWIENKGKIVILLPGVPREMKMLFEHRLSDRLKAISGVTLVTRILKLYGISESKLDEILAETMRGSTNPTLAPYAGSGEVELHVTASADTEEQAAELCRKLIDSLPSEVMDFCYGREKESLESALVSRFAKHDLTLATAESCTGGLLSERITSIAGASSVLSLGVCSYTEQQKMCLLGVPAELLKSKGVYSKECAVAMARGVKRLADSKIGIGITGIAGPSGATETDPVGCVYIAVTDGKRDLVERCVFGSQKPDRAQIRFHAASRALAMAMQFCGVFREFS